MTLRKGQRLGAYEIGDRLGAGGMGEVYRAHDPRLERDVAIKVLPPELAKSPERRLRFDREAKMLGALNHPNIAAIHGFERADGLDFLVLELVEGEGLDDRLARAPLPLAEVVDLALQIASACAAAHARGVVHRDLKPSNVMISEEGTVKVLDFGLARSLASSDGLASTVETAAEITAMGDTLGTPAYMSPEQALGRRVEEQSDLFSFGVVLYELLLGRHPFRDLSDASLIDAILHSDPPAPSSIRQGLPSAFDTLVASLLAKAPERRPSGFGEVVTSLESLEGAQESSAEPKDTARPTIAVLPFANLSSDSENEYLADGMADEIILALSKIESLRVLSRTSSFAFKGRAEDVRSIARTLGVKLVLEGSLRRAGDRIRVATQLVDASEGYQLWSDRYDRDSRDVFAVQEEIAEQVLGALRIVLTQRENEALQRLPTHDLEAYKLYQRGRTMLFQFTDEKFKTAQVLFRRAVERDEEFLPAWLGLTSACAWIYQWGLRPGSSEDLQIAVDASEHALAIAPDRAEALAARGLVSWLEGSVDEAVDLLGRAQTVDPRLWDAAYYLARVHHSRGEHEASFRQFMRAAEIRPDDYQSLCLALSMIEAMGEPERLVEVAERAATVVKRHLNLHPEDTRAYYLGAQALELLGERSLAEEWTERALALSPDDAGVGYNVACFCVKIGDLDRALELLEALAQRGWGFREWLETDPDLDPLRDDPRFEKMLDEMPTVEGRRDR